MIEAEPWVQIDPDPELRIEGPAFDREGNLFVTSPYHGRVYKVTPEKHVSQIHDNPCMKGIGCAIHKDGRLFLACGTGELATMNPDGSDVRFITARLNGKPQKLNDLVFDAQGNLYVTDFTGTVPHPSGGVYRFTSDFSRVDLILDNLAGANGISLAPEGDALWVGETFRNAILRIALEDDGVTIASRDGVCYAYYSTGVPGGPDSNKVDKEGNLYQCIVPQGRAIVLNARGIPVANILLPGRDEGQNLRSTNLAFRPGSNEGYIVASGACGPAVFKFPALAEGLPLYSHS
ncbi:MAG TPA: SMP-30/gluconolactonase/LRE family protein [Anaerolineae bacterium]|nr:SMP-30/gluconolactonase/LRE family protein [Anaerolineae bacterium]HOQ98023.1 SMP-30/gluconolactonase/LRE family protein [Anaerolineae bacterium]